MAFSDSRAWKFLHLVKNSTENALECYKFSLSRLTCLVVVVDEVHEFAHSMIRYGGRKSLSAPQIDFPFAIFKAP